MREIKFRAWHKHLKLMGSVITMHFGENIGEMCEIDLGNVEGRFITDPSSEFYFMQYTGLSDKNGVEIYEGDVLKGFNGNSGAVSFGRHLFQGTGLACQGWFFGDHLTLDGTLEVVGNIYENPELLEQQNAG